MAGSLGGVCPVRGCPPPCQDCVRWEARGGHWCFQCCWWWDGASQQGLLGLLPSDCWEVLCQPQPGSPPPWRDRRGNVIVSSLWTTKGTFPPLKAVRNVRCVLALLGHGWEGELTFPAPLDSQMHVHAGVPSSQIRFNYIIYIINYIAYLLLTLSK